MQAVIAEGESRCHQKFGRARFFVVSLLVKKVTEAPASLAPLDAVATALEAAEVLFPEHREASRQRQRIIATNAELQERDLMKLASLSAALAEALRSRGVGDPAAALAAEAGIAVFKLAFERWINETNQRTFPQLVQDTLSELKAVTVRSDEDVGLAAAG